MALVRENILVPTKDAPELGYVRESSSKQYVPDVFFSEGDKYGNEVTKLARPLPLIYLLIDMNGKKCDEFSTLLTACKHVWVVIDDIIDR